MEWHCVANWNQNQNQNHKYKTHECVTRMSVSVTTSIWLFFCSVPSRSTRAMPDLLWTQALIVQSQPRLLAITPCLFLIVSPLLMTFSTSWNTVTKSIVYYVGSKEPSDNQRWRRADFVVGWINDFLSWRAFIPLNRLAYSIYLIHVPTLRFLIAAQRVKVNGTSIDMVSIEWDS